MARLQGRVVKIFGLCRVEEMLLASLAKLSRETQLWNLGIEHQEQLPASFCMDDCDETDGPPPSWQAEIPTGP